MYNYNIDLVIVIEYFLTFEKMYLFSMLTLSLVRVELVVNSEYIGKKNHNLISHRPILYSFSIL